MGSGWSAGAISSSSVPIRRFSGKRPGRSPLWNKAHARYHRSHTGGGQWERLQAASRRVGDRLRLSALSSETHGLQAHRPVPGAGGQLGRHEPPGSGRLGAPYRVLNLFGYTGGATLACTAAGAQCHPRGRLQGHGGLGPGKRGRCPAWPNRPMRWLVDDCGKFVQRESSGGATPTTASSMDPPVLRPRPRAARCGSWRSRSTTWWSSAPPCLSDRPLFFAINSYTTGLSPSVMQYILGDPRALRRTAGVLSADEIGLPVTAERPRYCPAARRRSGRSGNLAPRRFPHEYDCRPTASAFNTNIPMNRRSRCWNTST